MKNSWIDGAETPTYIAKGTEIKDPVSYNLKKRLLGSPLNRHDLGHQRLMKRYALGILSSDCISSSAYGSEQILIALVPFLGLSAFHVLLPMTAVILTILVLLTISYNNVISKYTSSGGAYIVARENLGTFWSIVAAVALILDYIVTIAIQSAAGIVALASYFPSLIPYESLLTIAVILLLSYGNLRGVKEAGKAFALPTYLFVLSMFVVFAIGIYRQIFGHLVVVEPANGLMALGHHSGLLTIASIFILLRAFANGGSSLTGLEAISNGVSLFHSPEGRNARITMNIMSGLLGTLVFGVSWFATHLKAIPYESGTPSVISVISKAILGDGTLGNIWFAFTQFATMIILIAGANTVYNAFPILAANISNDGYLPRQFAKRGHKLVYSNGVIVCSTLAIALVLFTGGSVNKLVALYALGVFTAFTITGYGMFIHARTNREKRWFAKASISLAASLTSALVVVIFAIVKFTEGAWLVIVVAPTLVALMYRSSNQYRREQEVLDLTESQSKGSSIAKHEIAVLVDSVDLAVKGAVRYAISLKPRKIEAVHFVVDDIRAEEIAAKWKAANFLADIPLKLIDCPDRRLPRAALDFATRVTSEPGVELTLLLPRRIYGPFLGRVLHDQTAEQISRPISRLKNVVATIVPVDVATMIENDDSASQADGNLGVSFTEDVAPQSRSQFITRDEISAPIQISHFDPNVRKINEIKWRSRAHVVGQIVSMTPSPMSSAPSLNVEIWDDTGGISLEFMGRRSIVGLKVGRVLKAEGMVGDTQGKLQIMNPMYELLLEHEPITEK